MRDGHEHKCITCRNEQSSELNVARGRFRKREIVKSLGGECSDCGGTFHPAAFDFHHIDPDEKSFNISGGNLANKSLKKVLAEVSKCLLLCSNCHRKLHAMEYEKENDLQS